MHEFLVHEAFCAESTAALVEGAFIPFDLEEQRKVNSDEAAYTSGKHRMIFRPKAKSGTGLALSRKRTVTEIHEWGETLRTFSPFITILNDLTFTNYHKFGSESRILPEFTPVPDHN